MRKSLRVAVTTIASLLLVGGAAGYAVAAHSGAHAAAAIPQGTYTIATTLNAKKEVPAPKGASASATGKFTATLKVAGSKYTLAYKLTFAHLTGPALSSHIHLGVVGKAGRILTPICAPCASGVHKTGSISSASAVAMIDGKAYVNVHTAKNPAGEIRGQIKAALSGGGGGNANPYANVVVTPTAALVAQGKSLSTQFSCEGCHTTTGAASSGPTWKGLAGRNVKLTTGQTVQANDGYLVWSIEQPDAQIVAGFSSGIMTTAIGNISLPQAKALVAYIKSVK